MKSERDASVVREINPVIVARDRAPPINMYRKIVVSRRNAPGKVQFSFMFAIFLIECCTER
jgi:hypothetical protein